MNENHFPKKIILLNFHALGDIVIFTTALNILRDIFPDSEISLWTYKYSKDLLKHILGINNVELIDNNTFKFPYILYKGPKLLFKFYRTNKVDLVISFHPNKYINFLFVIFLRSYYKIIPGKGGLKDIVAKDFKSFKHGLNHYNEIMPKICFEAAKLYNKEQFIKFISPSLYIKDNDVTLFLEKFPFLINLNYIAVFPGGGSNIGEKTNVRQYPYMASVIKNAFSVFEHKPAVIVILGGIDDYSVCNKLFIKLKSDNFKVFNLQSKTNITEFIIAIKKASFLITGDSFPLHIASALNKPYIVIFGPTDYKEKFLKTEKSYAFYSNKKEFLYHGKFYGDKNEALKFYEDINKMDISNKIKEFYNTYYEKDFY